MPWCRQPALTLSLSPCNGGERGLLGVAVDPDFAVNGFLYLYFTHPRPSAPGGCVNRVSRFTMSANSIDPEQRGRAGRQHLLARRQSQRRRSGDRRRRVPVHLGRRRRQRSRARTPARATPAQDLSLLNGKILRVVPSTGEPAPGNPISGPGTASCRLRGNLPTTPTTPCQELYAWGLRNPFRFAFDPNTGPAPLLHQRRRPRHP